MPTRIDALSPSADWEAVRHWRKLVRDDLIQRRTALPSDIRRMLSASACARLVEAVDLRAFAVLGFCWPIRGEFDVRGIAKQFLASGGQVALPVVVQRSAPVEFWRWHPGMPMQTGAWNIPRPHKHVHLDDRKSRSKRQTVSPSWISSIAGSMGTTLRKFGRLAPQCRPTTGLPGSPPSSNTA